ncbi:MAG: DNA polymerase III subunit delta [Eubacteriales bacterium]|nr:DNA polymerase III subunit delta [Eubacteriales bacterium]
MSGFDGIIGNELIKHQLKAAIKTNKIRHAYMLAGEKGMGKRTMAEAFMLELFCNEEDEEKKPCLKCPECKKILSGNHPDIIYVNHEKPATISVDDIREQIMDTVDIKPYAGEHKVYVIPEADKMSLQAQNALLKTLEEPPAYVIILLLVNDEKKLLDTVRSRLVKERLRPLTDNAIESYLKDELNASGEMVDICVAFSKGNLGRAIELYNSDTFADWYQRVMKILRNIKTMSSTDIRVEIGKLQSECPDLIEALDLLELWYRDLTMFMITKNLNGLVFKGERKALMNMASVYSYDGVQNIMEGIEVCRERLNANVNPELSFELLFLRMKDEN